MAVYVRQSIGTIVQTRTELTTEPVSTLLLAKIVTASEAHNNSPSAELPSLPGEPLDQSGGGGENPEKDPSERPGRQVFGLLNGNPSPP